MGMKLIVPASGKTMPELSEGTVKDSLLGVATLAKCGFITYKDGEPTITVTKAPTKPGEKRETFDIPLASVVGVTLPQLERLARDADPLAGKRQAVAAMLKEGMTPEEFAELAKKYGYVPPTTSENQTGESDGSQTPNTDPPQNNDTDTSSPATGTLAV